MFGPRKIIKEFIIYILQLKCWQIRLANLVVNHQVIRRFTLFLVCRGLYFSFIVHACYNIGRNNFTSWNYLTKHWILLFIAFRIHFREASFDGTKGEISLFGGSPSILGNTHASTSALFHTCCSILCLSIHARTKTPNT